MGALFTATAQRYSLATSLSTLDISISMWVRRNADRGTFSVPFGLEDGIGGYLIIGTDATGALLYAEQFTGPDEFIAGPTLVTGTWTYVAFTRAGTGANSGVFYWGAEGAALTSGTATFAATLTGTTLTVGTHNADFFNGTIAHLKVWSAGLSAGEIENERRMAMPSRTANLFAWYPLLEGGATAGSLQDFSGNGRTLTNPGGSSPETTDQPAVAWRQGRRRLFIPAVAIVRRWLLVR